MPFKLSEYDRAFGLFVQDGLRMLAVAGDPLLSQIEMVPSTGPLGSVFQDEHGQEVDLAPGAITSDLTMSFSAVRDADIDAFVVQLDAGSAQIAEGYHKAFIATLETVTNATGNVVRPNGPFTFDVFYQSLDQIEWSLTEDDELSMPTLMMHPDLARRVPELTAEQEARLAELLERKLRELLARRRRRRLS